MGLGRPVLDLTGHRYGFLTVVRFAGKESTGHALWECLCDCGKTLISPSRSLRQGATVSCGCYIRRVTRERSIKHGRYGTPEYASYQCARNRCKNPNTDGYAYYGGRGIQFKFKNFAEFFAELGEKPSPSHTVDRKNNNGNYEIGNVKWSTPKEQAKNRRKACRKLSQKISGQAKL